VVISQKKAAVSATASLAILVSTDKHLDHVVKLTTAAFAKGKQVSLFFTGKGVLLTIRPQFKKLVGKASLSICDVSFRANGLHGREQEVPGVTLHDFVTQAKNAQMLASADRHLVL
jgi:predicted peroxiredoxin